MKTALLQLLIALLSLPAFAQIPKPIPTPTKAQLVKEVEQLRKELDQTDQALLALTKDKTNEIAALKAYQEDREKTWLDVVQAVVAEAVKDEKDRVAEYNALVDKYNAHQRSATNEYNDLVIKCNAAVNDVQRSALRAVWQPAQHIDVHVDQPTYQPPPMPRTVVCTSNTIAGITSTTCN